MKTIFLDMDGVLNDNGMTLGPICQNRLFLFHQILSETGADVVLSTAWRKYDDLCKLIWDAEIKYISKTPSLFRLWRSTEISAWLDDHPERRKHPFAIIDDREDAGYGKGIKENFFLTDGYVGLTKEIAQNVINHLNRNEKV